MADSPKKRTRKTGGGSAEGLSGSAPGPSPPDRRRRTARKTAEPQESRTESVLIGTADPTVSALPAEERLRILEQAVGKIGQLCLMLSGPGDPGSPTTAPVTSGTAAVPGAIPLRQFIAGVSGGELTAAERRRVADVAQAMLEQVYVHLPLKRAMHAVDPVQRLKILRRRIDSMSPRAFHGEMIAIFHSLRDLHTNYILPAAYQGRTAFLPFLTEAYYEGGDGERRRYVVTLLIPGFQHPDFAVGVNLTHWNGVPIDRAVEVNAEREAGSNDDARLARGLEALTIRPMGLTAPPDEEWVIIGYESGGPERDIRLDWMVFEPPPSPSGITLATADPVSVPLGVDVCTEAVRRAKKALFFPEKMDAERRMVETASPGGPQAREATPSARGPDSPAEEDKEPDPRSVLGLDTQTEAVRRGKKALFFPEKMDAERRMVETALEGGRAVSPADADPGPPDRSLMPDVFEFRRVSGPRGELGYIRIYTFMVNDADAFVREFVRIARLLPPSGLIVDVRGNGGGNILAGERLLQVLTPRAIDPERFHFINTEATLDLCRTSPLDLDLARWSPSIALAVETGETYSQGLTLEPVASYNRIGQQYRGPVVLIVDALCYSTTDIFSAGFQDHGIGKILGTSRHTGAGGANVWDYGLLQGALADRFPTLPKGTTFRVAIRRTTRVGDRAGVPVEDLGVEPDEIHLMTRADVLQGNVDLLARAARILVAP